MIGAKEDIYLCPQPLKSNIYIYQPLRSGRIWHKVNF